MTKEALKALAEIHADLSSFATASVLAREVLRLLAQEEARGGIAHVSDNDRNEIVVDFEPDKPHAWHVTFTLDEAEAFAAALRRRVQMVLERIAVAQEEE